MLPERFGQPPQYGLQILLSHTVIIEVKTFRTNLSPRRYLLNLVILAYTHPPLQSLCALPEASSKPLPLLFYKNKGLSEHIPWQPNCFNLHALAGYPSKSATPWLTNYFHQSQVKLAANPNPVNRWVEPKSHLASEIMFSYTSEGWPSYSRYSRNRLPLSQLLAFHSPCTSPNLGKMGFSHTHVIMSGRQRSAYAHCSLNKCSFPLKLTGFKSEPEELYQPPYHQNVKTKFHERHQCYTTEDKRLY